MDLGAIFSQSNHDLYFNGVCDLIAVSFHAYDSQADQRPLCLLFLLFTLQTTTDAGVACNVHGRMGKGNYATMKSWAGEIIEDDD